MLQLAGKKYHFIGAGGIGMSGLAKLLLKNGAIVTGSDQEHSRVTDSLIAMGADIKIGHAAENLPDAANAVVISAAIKESNPELAAARQAGATVFKYAEMLGELMDNYSGIAIAGTHGKSTTSGWLSVTMDLAGKSPSFIVGAEVAQLSDSSGAGTSQHFIAEACEYDRSFLNIHPQIAVILNVEQDHLDYYKDIDDIIDAFAGFANGIKPGGTVIVNGQDRNVAAVIKRLKPELNCLTFGLDWNCDFSAHNIDLIDGDYHFDIYHGTDHLGATSIALPGEHNIMNCLAVVAAATIAGLTPAEILKNLSAFNGIDRRIMLKAKLNDITILDDYAHHPTEIKASLSAIRQKYAPKRLWCIFQPHQYSRTRFLLDDFAESFKLADITVVPDIYFVRDTAAARKQVNAQVLVESICRNGCQAMFIDDFGKICEHLKEHVTAGDLVVTMGAGDIWKVADEYIYWLSRDS